MSRRTDAKKARRRKRRSTRDQVWLPAGVLDELDVASRLEDIDERLTARGWEFIESGEDDADGAGVYWIWPDSAANLDHDPDHDVDGDVDHDVDGDLEAADVTVVMLSPDEDGQVAHVVFVGGDVDYQFGLGELFTHIDAIEAYRIGDPIPAV